MIYTLLKGYPKQAFSQIMDQQKRLEKQLNDNIKAFNKFQSAVNNTKLDSATKRIDKLTSSIEKYNKAVSTASSGKINPTSGGSSSSVKDFMVGDY